MQKHKTFWVDIYHEKWYDIGATIHAGVAELADALDLGSSGLPVQVQVLSPAPREQRSEFGTLK